MYRLYYVQKNFLELHAEMKSWPLGQRLILYSVFISLAGGRWASYIGFPAANLFLIDILFFGGWLLSWNRFLREATSHRIIFHVFLFAFILFQFQRNFETSPIMRIRDLIPYIYFITLPVITLIFQNVNLRVVIIAVRLATLLHLAWLIPIVLHLIKPVALGGPFGIPIFSDRWDQSGMAIALGILAWKQNEGFRIQGNVGIQVIFVLCGLFQWSRASLIAISISILLSFYNSPISRKSNHRKKNKYALIIPYVAIISLLLLPSLESFIPTNSVINRLGITNNSESLQKGAAATVDARKISQKLLFDWVVEKESLLLGVGPGNEMVLESGAYIYLSGDPDVRSPHSWLYGGVSRFGVFGFGFWLLLLANGFRPHFKIKKIVDSPLHYTIPILIVSLFGVIIESPFGSLPLVFFTAIAIRK